MKNRIKLLCLLIALLVVSTCLLIACEKHDCQTDGHKFVNGVCKHCGKEDAGYLVIHYKRSDADYAKWGYWIWVTGADGKLFEHNDSDSYGGIAKYSLDEFGKDALTKGIGIIPRLLTGWTKDVDADRMISFSDYEADENNCYHIYIREGDVILYKDVASMPAFIRICKFETMTSIKVIASETIAKLELLENGTVIATETNADSSSVTLNLPDGVEADIGNAYTVNATFASGKTATQSVSISALYSSEEFNTLFAYDGNDLGAIISEDKTTTSFKVWSPVSQSIKLNIYSAGNETVGQPSTLIKSVDMTRGDKGVWYHIENDNLECKYYTYTVTNATYPNGREIVDPYAKSAGLSGKRGQIVDFDNITLTPDDWTEDYLELDRKSLVVYETHVADVTSSKTWTGTESNRKKYLGMIESGTTYSQDNVTVTTGFDHIKELGVNAVQLLPIFDQDNNESNVAFNWGYNPLNYNVLEGAYSSDPTDGYVRIREFKQLVQAYKNEGIGIIMDVVYNHTSSNVGSNFDVLMPGYYYRYNSDGSSSSGSGCGNDTASENYMFRKFMIDSVCFWAKEYNLAGFRFDLMGLHDLETMNLLVAELKKINPNIVVYGEPWSLTTATNKVLATQSNGNKYEGFGQFNDQGRDALIKGGLSGANEKGWITGTTNNSEDVAKIMAAFKGFTKSAYSINDPDKTVNYVTCHDNYTLYDRIKAAGIKDATTIKQMAMLANSVVLTSNGTSFILAGEEFLRTKGGDHNSYQSSYKVNELDYSLKVKHFDMFQNYQKLIWLKRNASGLSLDKDGVADAVNFNVVKSDNKAVFTLIFKAEYQGQVREFKVVHANGSVANTDTINFDGYTLYLDTLNVQGLELTTSTQVRPYQTIIAYK